MQLLKALHCAIFKREEYMEENTNQKIFAQKVTRHGTRGYPPKYAAPRYEKPDSIR
jgi:hypothetical protein